MQRHIIDYIRRPDTIDDDAIAQLQALTQEHPYFHIARILLLQALYKKHDPAYDETLRRTAILVPNREAIFRLTEEPHYTQAEEHKRYEETTDDSESRTVSLIDNFLEAQTPVSPVSHPIDAAQDYIGYLLQQESRQGTQRQEALPMNGGGVVEDFLENEHGRIVLDDNLEDEHNESQSDDSNVYENDENNEILTEIMAGIYIKQGKYENAVKIIRQLSLKYPKKNRYFADQIRFLEKLIINNKHK
ncbi:MAG: tetratricopeptide repeat protein [Bacteroidaceae bacterium]|nr:tetratricopeptide repeat protein [Bacteroidaceae bacterium]